MAYSVFIGDNSSLYIELKNTCEEVLKEQNLLDEIKIIENELSDERYEINHLKNLLSKLQTDIKDLSNRVSK